MGNEKLSAGARTTSSAPRDETVGILGLGAAGRSALECFRLCGYDVAGWDAEPALHELYGKAALESVMKRDVLVITSDQMLDELCWAGELFGFDRAHIEARAPWDVVTIARMRERSKRLRGTLWQEVGPGGEVPDDCPVLLTPKPWLLRLEGSAGSAGQFFVRSRSQITTAIRLWENAHGPSDSTWQLCPDLRAFPNVAVDLMLDHCARPTYSFVRQRESTLDAGMRTSGLSSSARVARIPVGLEYRNRIRAKALRVVKSLLQGEGIPTGPFGVDFRWPRATEVNAGRFNTTAWDWSRAGEGEHGRGHLAHLYVQGVARSRERSAAVVESSVVSWGGQRLVRDPGHDARLTP